MSSGLADADWATSPNNPMPQGKQDLAAVDEVLVVVGILVVYTVGGLLVQWRLWAVVCLE